MAQVIVPALTTVHIPLRDLGRMGVQRLLALLNHESVPDLELLPTTIVERDTTAPLPDLPSHLYK
jgi:LacI family transcriptional regulator